MKRHAAPMCLTLLSALALSACEQPQARREAPAGSTAVQPRVSGGAEEILAMPPSAALEKAGSALRARGFVVAPVLTPGAPLEASSGGQTVAAWASCPQITVRDPFAEAFRARRTGASDFETRVTVTAVPAAADQTQLSVRSLSIGSYQNSFIGTAQQASCRSTGVLERELLQAVRGP